MPTDNVIVFPLNRRRVLRGCPQCGSRDDVWPIGRLLWGFCTSHELRWVVADLRDAQAEALDRPQVLRRLEMLSSFVEVSRG